jgi:hypothetical protein
MWSKVQMSNKVHEVQEIQEVGAVRFQEQFQNDSSSQSSDQVETKSWFARYEQFLYGTIVGGAAVIFSLSVRSLLRSK